MTKQTFYAVQGYPYDQAPSGGTTDLQGLIESVESWRPPYIMAGWPFKIVSYELDLTEEHVVYKPQEPGVIVTPGDPTDPVITEPEEPVVVTPNDPDLPVGPDFPVEPEFPADAPDEGYFQGD